MTAAETLREAVLAWVNATRAEYREDLLEDFPRGARASSVGCTLALALPGVAQVGLGQFKINDGPWRDLPTNAHEFYQQFDRGGYPDLIAEEAA